MDFDKAFGGHQDHIRGVERAVKGAKVVKIKEMGDYCWITALFAGGKKKQVVAEVKPHEVAPFWGKHTARH